MLAMPLLFLLLASPAAAQPPLAAARYNEPGPEAEPLLRDVGAWDVTATLRPTPDAKPVVTSGLIAQRVMIGLALQETITPTPGSGVPYFQRIDYLSYSAIEGRWQYVSLDTRMPVGIMPAWSFDRCTPLQISLQFEPIAFVGMGSAVSGKMLRSSMVITRDGNDHQTKRQSWVMADGTGVEWVAVQYDYRRKH